MTQALEKTASEIILPAEWAPQRVMWAGWPSHGDLWLENLEPARAEVVKMIALLAEGQKVHVMAMGADAVKAAKAALPVRNVEIFDFKFGDMWPRDTGPVFSFSGLDLVALRFRNNGWGGKYDLPHDDTIGDDIASVETKEVFYHDYVLEGGSIEWDGEGTILTTRECVLNKNRNNWSEAEAEEHLKKTFGAKKILWLDGGMVNDHTDGHIDNIARFVAPGKVVCQKGFGEDDPNTEIFETIAKALSKMTDASGRKLEVIQIPSPGLVTNEDGDPVPASHVNFLIGNKAVAVPTYGTASADQAVADLQKLFPGRKVQGIHSRAILTGGGSFHCMSQQVPA
jgi:agmatine deiminase